MRIASGFRITNHPQRDQRGETGTGMIAAPSCAGVSEIAAIPASAAAIIPPIAADRSSPVGATTSPAKPIATTAEASATVLRASARDAPAAAMRRRYSV